MTTRQSDTGAALLQLDSLHGSVSDPVLASMGLLNEIAERYPGAVSFAAGRPYEGTFRLDDLQRYLKRFVTYLRDERTLTDTQITRTLFQYGPTKGIIADLIARNLAVDENIHVSPEALVVTVGCQEAMVLALRTLCAGEHDAVLAVSPTYVGLAGAARLLDIPVLPVRPGTHGVDLDHLSETIRAARIAGIRPRAFYVIPDFSNPLGSSLPATERGQLLDIATREDILLWEDNPYGLFNGGSSRPPTLKCLDTGGRVVYLGSFAKTALPGARIGYAVADQTVVDHAGGKVGLLADEMAKVKSMLTVNTSPIAQAVVGGKLLEHGFSLAAANRREIEVYARNMRLIQTGLAERFPDPSSGVAWNTPGGGFFLVLTVPFRVSDELLEQCANHHGVIWTPMHHFYAQDVETHQIRLSGSLLEPEQISDGLDRLAAFIHAQSS